MRYRSCRLSASFSALSGTEIEAYVATGEPLDKAGAYAIQGGASKFVTRVEGCYFNVVGLPISTLLERLADLGALPEWPRRPERVEAGR